MKKYLIVLLAVALIGCGKDGGLGPQGPAGPTGSTGQAGLNGTNALNNVKTYIVSGPADFNPIVVPIDSYDIAKPPLFIAYTAKSGPRVWTSASISTITANSVTVSHAGYIADTALVYQIISLE